MTVGELVEKMGLKVFNLVDKDEVIYNFCASDLLSYVIDKAKYKCCWLTIMSNVNIVAVATLADPACIILSENVQPDDNALRKAQDVGVNILGSTADTFSLCARISELI